MSSLSKLIKHQNTLTPRPFIGVQGLVKNTQGKEIVWDFSNTTMTNAEIDREVNDFLTAFTTEK